MDYAPVGPRKADPGGDVWGLAAGWRRATGGANSELRTFIEDDEGSRAARIVELRRPGSEGDLGVRTQLGRGARGAVLRRLQLALQVVVFEGRCDQEEGVQHRPDNRQAPRETTALSSNHLHRLYALNRQARQRPTAGRRR